MLPFFSKISQDPGQNQQIGKQCCLSPLSFNISLTDTSFHIFLNSLEFYLSRECLLNFLWFVHSTKCGKIFSVYGAENALNLCIFTYVPVPHSKLQDRIFWKCISPRRRGWMEETMICFIEIQSENLKMTWNINLFIFCMICNFSKFDGFTVL